MDGPNLHLSPLNPQSETLIRNSENRITQRKKTMEKFQKIVFKLAESTPNAPLTPAARNHIQERLNRFVSKYNTPDHPPYSAMIERAIRELNEKRGSSEDSISHFLAKEYDNLPWAHPAVLKLHLRNLCESGDIVRTGRKRYRLTGQTEIPTVDSQSMKKVERKPPRSRKRLKRDRGREKKEHRKPVLKLKIKFGSKNAEAIVKSPEYDQKEKGLAEEIGGNLVSGPDVDLNPHCHQSLGPPEIIEPVIGSTRKHEQPEEQKREDLNSRQQPVADFISHQHRIGPFGITGHIARSAHTSEKPESEKPEDLNSRQQAIGPPEIKGPEATFCMQTEHSPSEIPGPSHSKTGPFENLPNSGPTSALELLDSENENHSLDSAPVCMSEKKYRENNVAPNGGEKYSRKRKRKFILQESVEACCEQLCPKPDFPCLPFSTNQEVPPKHEAIFQKKEPRRSLRLRLTSKLDVTNEANPSVVTGKSRDSLKINH